MDELTAIGRARRLVAGISSAPVDAYGLATAHGMEVKESDQLGEGEAGNTFRKGTKTIIVVNKNNHPFRRRFTVLHELAHHFLELPSKHGASIPSSDLERFVGRPPEEKMCDVFAAECLVPAHLIRPLTDSPFSVKTVQRLSDDFEASRPCIASSFVRSCPNPIAYVFAENGRISNVLTSAALREHRVFIQDGRLPSSSAAARALANDTSSENAELDGTDWSSSDAADQFVCTEEALHLRGWKQTLSFLTFERVGSARHEVAEPDESEELLPELTGHLPWPKK
ncbi:MAG: ImmA/IrrE family metallo-endopeptidase [Rhodanobacteraceae bacterium]|nr:ImmA/IrrE family metallo-endopeptidase [Rhodanobacteraceae bacterium]